MEEKKERVNIYMDGANFFAGLKKISTGKFSDFNFNFVKFFDIISKNYDVKDINYYNGIIKKDRDSRIYREQINLFNYLRREKNINVFSFPIKTGLCPHCKQPINKIKGDDIKMAIDIVRDALLNEYDRAIIITGDTDFIPAIKLIKELGKKVSLHYFEGHCGFDLIDICDETQRISKTRIRKCGFKKK